MNVGEYGLKFYLNVNYDISQATGLTLVFTPPNGTTFVATSPSVAVGTAAYTSLSDGVYPANQYCVYTFVNGDLSMSGDYAVRLVYTDGTKRLTSDTVKFHVNP